ncbi:MAG TPA: hypothetical protein PKD86_09535 [Gemmatales bacterium]|nr:hypothetical protein [Gemmatales bacterium]HMP59582.1 hypothetical protein [Gemmatales bacterium]
MNTSTSPKVQYAYSEMPSGANHSRLTSITYPNGRVMTYNYASGLASDISRLSSISDGGPPSAVTSPPSQRRFSVGALSSPDPLPLAA